MVAILSTNVEEIYEKMDKQNPLELRKRIKANKPKFIVKEAKFTSGVKRRWRFPRGKHSAVRQMHKGRPKLPGVGFSSPKAARYLHHSGLQMVVIHNVQQLLSLEPKTQGAVISSGVGKKSKLQILNVASEKNIQLLNIKDVKKEQERLQKEFEGKKEAKRRKLKDKDKKAEEKKKKAEKKSKKKGTEEKGDEKESVEDKIKEEEEKQKEIIEKTITKRQ